VIHRWLASDKLPGRIRTRGAGWARRIPPSLLDWRGFLAALVAVLVAPLPAEAQQTMKRVKIGWIAITPQDRNRGPEQFGRIR
jgi:hypothetical protein